MAMATAAPAANAKKDLILSICRANHPHPLCHSLYKKIFSWKLRENAGATLVDDFYFAFY